MCPSVWTGPWPWLSNWDFYLPKLLLLGALWLVGIVSFGITRAQQSQDIAVNDIDDMRLNGYPALKITARPGGGVSCNHVAFFGGTRF